MRLLAFCEAAADFRVAAELVDRVLRETCPVWVAELLDAAPESVRVWHRDPQQRPFFDIHRIDTYARELALRIPHGHFDGASGRHGSLMARTAFAIVRSLKKRGADIGATILVWDMDDDGAERQRGLAQARAEAETWAGFAIVLGCPNANREAWVLTGFEPVDEREESDLMRLRAELDFAPNSEAHRLDAKPESAKRVLSVLIGDDPDRESRCWTDTALETLRARSAQTGLREFLDELAGRLAPLVVSS